MKSLGQLGEGMIMIHIQVSQDNQEFKKNLLKRIMSVLNKIKNDRYKCDSKLPRFDYYFSQLPISQRPIRGESGLSGRLVVGLC